MLGKQYGGVMLGQFLSPDLEETGSFHIPFLEVLTFGAPAAMWKGHMSSSLQQSQLRAQPVLSSKHQAWFRQESGDSDAQLLSLLVKVPDIEEQRQAISQYLFQIPDPQNPRV